MIQNIEKTLKEIQSKVFAPCYLLHGEEGYSIDQIMEAIEQNALTESEKSFNQIVLYGKDTQVNQILAQARRFPMMAERQVVIVKEFQQLEDLKKNDAKKALENYLQQSIPSTILICCHKYKTLAKNTSLYKSFEKYAVVVECKKYSDDKLVGWINQYVQKHKITVDPKAVAMLIEYIGSDMGRLATELDKLLLNLKQNDRINEGFIEKNVGISKDYNVFELQRAIANKDATKIYRIIQYWESNPKSQSIIPSLALLYGFFSKLLIAFQSVDKTENGLAKAMGVAPYVIKDYTNAMKNYSLTKLISVIHALHIADCQSKGIDFPSMNEASIWREFFGKILS